MRLSDVDKCLGQNIIENIESKPQKTEDEVVETKGVNTTFSNIFSNNTKAELNDIYIEKLKIISKNNPEQPIILKQINHLYSY